MKLSIIIPVYNEINTVLEVLKRVQGEKHDKEIIVVDDGSCDGTTELLKDIKNENVKLLFNKINKGKGYAIRQAREHTTGDIVIIQDADLEYYPDEYGILINKIAEGKADVVYGTRFLGAHRIFHFYHYLGNLILNLIANCLLDATLSDLMTGFKAFRRDVFKKIVIQADRFGIEAEITAEIFKRKYRIYETPISYEGRTYEEGKKIKWPDFFDCVYWLLKAKFRSIDAGEETLLRMRIMKNNNVWLCKKIKPYIGKNILDVGSGIGTIARYLCTQGKSVIFTDVNEDHINYLKNRFIGNPYVKVVKNDITGYNPEIKNEQADTMVCVNVLEHINDDKAALRNMREYLTQSGKLIIVVPAHNRLFSIMDKKLHHYRRYSMEGLSDKLNEQGFVIEHREYMNAPAAIGWFIMYKILKQKHMSKLTIGLFDKFIPIVAKLEENLKPSFGLSIFIVAGHG